MRWMIACMSWLLLPLPVAAKCHFINPPFSLHCQKSHDIPTVLAPWGEGDDFFPSDEFDRPEHPHWAVEREPPQQHFHLPQLRLGTASVGYRRREVTLSQDCWEVSFRAFSNISVFCRSSF